jgi:hypothetical protein
MRSERKPIRDLGRKINFLQRSPLAQELCGHTGSQKNFAEILGIARETLRDAIKYERMSEDDQSTLARKCQFNLLWHQWNDTDGQKRDTMDQFEARYIQEYTINRVQRPSPASDKRPMREVDDAKDSTGGGAKDQRSIDSMYPDRMTLEEFVARLSLSHVKVIRIIATTGKVTVMQLLQSIQDAAKRGHDGVVDIQILLSAAYMSDAGRPAGLALTRKLIREFRTIPRSRQNPKILWGDDAKIIGDGIAIGCPVFRNVLAQEH